MKAYRSTIMSRSACSVLLVAAFGLVAPANAWSQQPTRNKAAAEALFLEAKSLMEGDQYKEACPKLEESQRQDPAAGTLMYLAHCYEKTNRGAMAWTSWRAAESMARAAHKPEREKTAREKAEALESSMSSLRINVPSASRFPGMEIKRDAVLLASELWGEPVPIDPGDHAITVSAPGRKPWKTQLAIGATRSSQTLEVPVMEPEGAAPVAPAAPAAPVAPVAPAKVAEPRPFTEPQPSVAQDLSSPSFWTQRKVGYVIGAAGLVGLGVGTYFGLRASSKEKDSNSHCMAENQNYCDATGLALNKEAQDAEKLAIGAFVVGGILTATGLVVVLTAPSTQPAAPKVGLAPRVAPGFGGWMLSGTW